MLQTRRPLSSASLPPSVPLLLCSPRRRLLPCVRGRGLRAPRSRGRRVVRPAGTLSQVAPRPHAGWGQALHSPARPGASQGGGPGLFAVVLGSAPQNPLESVLGAQLLHLNFVRSHKAFSCVTRFDFSGCQAWRSDANVPQVSLSELPGPGPGAHLSGAAPVLAPPHNPSCLVSKTPSRPELKAESFWKEFTTNAAAPLSTGPVLTTSRTPRSRPRRPPPTREDASSSPRSHPPPSSSDARPRPHGPREPAAAPHGVPSWSSAP